MCNMRCINPFIHNIIQVASNVMLGIPIVWLIASSIDLRCRVLKFDVETNDIPLIMQTKTTLMERVLCMDNGIERCVWLGLSALHVILSFTAPYIIED